MVKTIKEIISTVLLAVIIYILVSIFVKVGRIDGQSMMPTYENGNRVIISRKFFDLEKDDIIAFKYTDMDDEYFEKTYKAESHYDRSLHIKRIIGMPGDHVVIKDDTLIVNDKEISKATVHLENQDYILPKDKYFVQGDNINDSYDSRMHGPISKEDVYGEIINLKNNS